MEYRYMVWNDVKRCYQFPSICETTEKGANTILFKKIGYDSYKYRFHIKRVEKEEAYKIRQELKDNALAEKVKMLLPNISKSEIKDLVLRNKNS